MHEQPAAGDEVSPGGGEDPGHGAVDRGVDVGVGEDDVRGLAAEFECDLGDVVGGALHHGDTGGGRSGEGDLVDARFSAVSAASRLGRRR